MLGHSQKRGDENELERKLRLETATRRLRRRTKKNKSEEDGSYRIAQLLKLAMETEEERKARLKKMAATTQLRLAPETDDDRRARLEYLSDNPIVGEFLLFPSKLMLVPNGSSKVHCVTNTHTLPVSL